jgi:hypothetical protein
MIKVTQLELHEVHSSTISVFINVPALFTPKEGKYVP